MGPPAARHQPADPSPAGVEPGAGTRPGRAGGERDPHGVTRLRPPLRIAESPQDGGASARLAETRAVLARLERDYRHALRQAYGPATARRSPPPSTTATPTGGGYSRLCAASASSSESSPDQPQPRSTSCPHRPPRDDLAAAPDDAA
jgi:hypothetical protein